MLTEIGTATYVVPRHTSRKVREVSFRALNLDLSSDYWIITAYRAVLMYSNSE